MSGEMTERVCARSPHLWNSPSCSFSPACFSFVPYFTYPSPMKMASVLSPETFVSLTTWHIPVNTALHTNSHLNLKPNVSIEVRDFYDVTLSTDISEERITSILMYEKRAKYETTRTWFLTLHNVQSWRWNLHICPENSVWSELDGVTTHELHVTAVGTQNPEILIKFGFRSKICCTCKLAFSAEFMLNFPL
jgi:hypothetical protein